MKMQKRTNLVTQFSSFLCLKEESSYLITYWKNTPELEKNIKLLLQQQIIPPQEDILAQEFLRWLRQQQDDLKYRHLIAYLQESCFFATQKVYQRLKNYWHLLTWEDYFQWANILVSSPVQLLSKYDSKFKTQLITYARHKLEYQLIDHAYKYMGWERASDWGLLKKLTIINQKKCLQIIGGLKDTSLEQHLLLWQCFNLVYKSQIGVQNKQLKPPSARQFNDITNEYNFLVQNKRKNLPLLSVNQCTQMLSNCIKFARQYCNPSIMTTKENLYDFKQEIQSNITEEIIDREEEYLEVNNILTFSFAQLEMPQQILFQLWKGLQLTQTEIVEIMMFHYPNFVTNQYQVAREISAIRNFILEKLINQLLQKPEQLTKKRLKELKNPLDYWLQEHCQQILFAKVYQLYQSFSQEKQQIIYEYLIEHEWSVSSILNSSFLLEIARDFKENISTEYKLYFPDNDHIEMIFINFIEEWINNSAYPLLNKN